jgi:multidrug efflux pump subunit AcrA (membrane-fusion protein)
MKAKVYFTAYKSIKIRPIDGDVYYVSADSLVDEKSGLSYYQAYVIPNVEQLATLDKGVILTPGMPVDVIIKTGERTPLDYMLSPLKDSLRQSFIEE